MSAYGAVAYRFKASHCSTLKLPYALKISMLSSPAQKKELQSIERPESSQYLQEDVEIGTDPLAQLPDVSINSDFSFCNIDFQDCSSPKPGSSSPAGECSEYFIPNDYPRDLGLDNELELLGSKEPYVMADFTRKDDLHYLGNTYKSEHPKGSLDFNRLQSPGAKHELSLRSIPKIYPELSMPSSSDSSFRSAEEYTINSSSSHSPTGSAKGRSNPFNDSSVNFKYKNPQKTVDAISPYNAVLASESRDYTAMVNPAPRDHSYAINTQPINYYSNSYTTRSADNSTQIVHLKPKTIIKSQGQSSEIDEVVTALRGTLNNAVQIMSSWSGNNFEAPTSICFLGKLYFNKHHHGRDERRPNAFDTESVEERVGSFHEFLKDFQSRVWVTYRRGFSCLHGTTLTSDTGWGCMLRTGQMMLATALQVHCFGRGWRKTSPFAERQFRQLVRLFGESSEYPFSLQNLLKVGKDHLNKSYGEWYGPSTVAYVLRVCVDYAKEKESSQTISPLVNFSNFNIFTATDCMLFKGDIINSATLKNKKQWTKTLVLISVRMGADELNLSYRHPIEHCLSNRLCIGIMGGRKRHSLYFTGFQGNKLIHYDPHYCQPIMKMKSDDFNTETYVCVKPRKMSFSKMDPSSTFAFYLASHADLDELIALSENMGPHKIFELLDGTKEDYLALCHEPCVRAFDQNESMFDDGDPYSMADIGSLEGSDFEYLE